MELSLAPDVAQHATDDLMSFTLATNPRYVADPFHRDLAACLDRVANHELGWDRLIITAPPQHGKSELISVRMPAYLIAKNPDERVIISSYGADLAEEKSAQVRDIITSDEYHQIAPGIELRQDTRSKARWNLDGHMGGLIAAGVNGRVTGWGASFVIIDDPVKDMAEAMSAVTREATWTWYQTTLRSRLRMNARIVLLMTRWHEDDLAGRLIVRQPGRWKIIRYSALGETQEERDNRNIMISLPAGLPDPIGREPGEPLSPTLYTQEHLEETRSDVGSMGWEALYMGVPRPPEGAMFKTAWLREFTADEIYYQLSDGRQFPIAACTRFATADLAFTEKETADYSVICVWAVTPDLDLLLLSMFRIQGEETAVIDELHTMQHNWRPMFIAIETNGFSMRVIKRAQAQGLIIKECVADKDKKVRALPAAIIMEGGMLFLRKNAPWRTENDDEVFSFPYSRNDDIVDNYSIAAQMRPSKTETEREKQLQQIPGVHIRGHRRL